MFYRVTNFDYAPERKGAIESWIDTITDQVRAIKGLVGVDVFEAMPGESVIVAAYDDQDAFEAAAGTVHEILGQLGQYLSKPPVTLAGTPFWSTRA